MTKAKAKTVNIDKIICLSLCGAVIVFIILYMYFLSASIAQVVIRKEINQDLVTLQTEISELETDYIDSQNQMSDKIASLQGYAPVTNKVFIDRSADSLALRDGSR